MIVQKSVVFIVRPLNTEKSSAIVVFSARPDATRYCKNNTPRGKNYQDYFDIVSKTVRVR
jgi:hypothetical protein